jgi:hypothetical protein
VASRNSPGARRAPGSDRRRGICGRLIDLSDLLQDFRLHPRTIVYADVRDEERRRSRWGALASSGLYPTEHIFP